MNRIVVGISGASGMPYALSLMNCLHASVQPEIETFVVPTRAARKVWDVEMKTPGGINHLLNYCDHYFDEDNFLAPIASGSFLTDGMVVVPCSIKTLSGIVHSYNDTLLIRAADVTLKEKRKLVLVVRENPLHAGHLKLMYEAANLGAVIMPPVTCFYNHPDSIGQMVDHLVGKILDQFGIEHNIMKRWCGR